MAGVMAVSGDALADPSTTSIEQGYDLGELQSPRSLGMGGALNALGASTTALSLNPAAMSLARVYHLEGSAVFAPEARRQSYSAAVVDSVLNAQHFAGGLAGSWSIMDPDGIRRQWVDVRAAGAYPLGDRLSIGVVGRYLRLNQNVGAGPLGVSFASDGTKDEPLLNIVTFDAGLNVLIAQGLRLGVVGHNLTNPGNGIAPTTVAAGLGFQTQTLVLEADGLVDLTTFGKARWRAMLGGELFVAQRFAVRAGYRYDEGTKVHALSGGLGYNDKSWGIELGLRRDIVGDHPSTFLTLSLRYFYQAPGTVQDMPDTM